MNESFHEFYIRALKRIKHMKEVEKQVDLSKVDDYEAGLSAGKEDALTQVLMFMYEEMIFSEEEE